MFDLKNSWNDYLIGETKKDYYISLRKILVEEYKKYEIYPKSNDIFNCLKETPYEKVKVVILGQDPYHEPNQAHGYCFSVPYGVKKPPSLENIFKELKRDLGIPIRQSGNLINWAKSGVLLLNTVLTVRRGLANSHKNIGWEKFTDKIIEILNFREQPLVYLLWGNNAKAKKELISNKHYILTTSHPSPFSVFYGFSGCGHFSKANKILSKFGEKINW